MSLGASAESGTKRDKLANFTELMVSNRTAAASRPRSAPEIVVPEHGLRPPRSGTLYRTGGPRGHHQSTRGRGDHEARSPSSSASTSRCTMAQLCERLEAGDQPLCSLPACRLRRQPRRAPVDPGDDDRLFPRPRGACARAMLRPGAADARTYGTRRCTGPSGTATRRSAKCWCAARPRSTQSARRGSRLAAGRGTRHRAVRLLIERKASSTCRHGRFDGVVQGGRQRPLGDRQSIC